MFRGEIVSRTYDLDVIGRYARPDVFHLIVDERPKPPVIGGAIGD